MMNCPFFKGMQTELGTSCLVLVELQSFMIPPRDGEKERALSLYKASDILKRSLYLIMGCSRCYRGEDPQLRCMR